MSTLEKFAKYPEVYSKIVLAAPADGSTLDLTVSSNDAAMAERLRFYNFLKFVRRNRKICAHLHEGNRCNLITVRVSGSTMSFSLRGKEQHSLESAFEQTAGHMQITLPEAAKEQTSVNVFAPPTEISSSDFFFPEAAPNLLDMLTAHNPPADDEKKSQ